MRKREREREISHFSVHTAKVLFLIFSVVEKKLQCGTNIYATDFSEVSLSES